MEDTNVTVEVTPQTPAPVANSVAPATAEPKTTKVLRAELALTENKYEYFLLTLEDEKRGAAIWPNELEKLIEQDEAICMDMLGLEKFCFVLKGAEVEVEKTTEGEGDNASIVINIKKVTIDDRLGIVAGSVKAFMQQMLS